MGKGSKFEQGNNANGQNTSTKLNIGCMFPVMTAPRHISPCRGSLLLWPLLAVAEVAKYECKIVSLYIEYPTLLQRLTTENQNQ